MEPNMFGRSIRHFSRRYERRSAKGSAGQPAKARYAKNVSLQLFSVSLTHSLTFPTPTCLVIMLLHICAHAISVPLCPPSAKCFVCPPSLPKAKLEVILVKQIDVPLAKVSLAPVEPVRGAHTYPSDTGALTDGNLDSSLLFPRGTFGRVCWGFRATRGHHPGL